jgi:TonB family protein
MSVRRALVVVLALAVATLSVQAQGGRLTVARLKALKASSNDPAGDAFVGSREQLIGVVDDFVADSSMASPMFLYFAANTAFRLGRIEDAAFLFYAAQLRRAVDFQRYNISAEPDGNNAITYLMFLNETTGMSVNPAIMRQPAQFSSVIRRLEKWEIVASPQAYYPEFAEAKGFKLPAPQWSELARTTKQSFMEAFGKPMVTLLNDKEYFEAFVFVQKVNLGEIPESKETIERFTKAEERMDAIERRLLGNPIGDRAADPPPDPPVTTPSRPEAKRESAPAPPPMDAGTMPVRVGGNIPEPKLIKRVEPTYPQGGFGSVILEVTVGTSGAVTDVRVLRGDPRIEEAVEAAVRQWIYEPTIVAGKAVPALVTVAVQRRP